MKSYKVMEYGKNPLLVCQRLKHILLQKTAELTRLDAITYKHNRIIIEPSSPGQPGFFVCGRVVRFGYG